MMTAQELQQELLQLLNEEFKQLREKLKEESKSSELRINKAFDRMLGNLRKKPEDSANKEIKPPDSDWATDLVRSQEAAIEAIENPQELPDENLEVEAVEDLPEEKPSEETNVKWLEEPAIVEIKRVEKLQEASAKVSIDAKGNTQPISTTPHNQNLSTINNPNPNSHPIQTQSFQAVNHNTAAFLDANRPEPWPNKPSINTNPNRPNPWPNKLPKLTYFIRPKPWPDEPPIYKHKPRTGSNETRKFGKQTKRRRSYRFQLLVKSKSDDHLQTSPMAVKVRILDFSVTIHALKWVHYQFWSTLSRAATIDSLNSDELKETRGDPGMTLTDEAAPIASMAIQLKEMKVEGGDRLRSRPGRLPTMFLGVVRPRARLERQLLDSSEANRILNRFQNRVLSVAQLRVMVIAILRHLPEFDPGDFRSKKDKGRISFEFNGYLGHFGRIFEGNRRRIEENSRWFSEKRRIGIVLEENRRRIEEEVAGLSKKKKKIWANSELGIWIEDLGDWFVEEKDVLQSSCETVSFCISPLGIRNGGVLKEISVGLIGLAGALWRTGSIGLGPIGLLM